MSIIDFKTYLTEGAKKTEIEPTPSANRSHGYYGTVKGKSPSVKTAKWNSSFRHFHPYVQAAGGNEVDTRNFLDSGFGKHLAIEHNNSELSRKKIPAHQFHGNAARQVFGSNINMMKAIQKVIANKTQFDD